MGTDRKENGLGVDTHCEEMTTVLLTYVFTYLLITYLQTSFAVDIATPQKKATKEHVEKRSRVRNGDSKIRV